MLWLNYSPQVHWPLSGSVAQDIHPTLLAQAGNDETELRVLREVASYGKQIGVLCDLLLGVAKLVPPDRLDADGRHALAQLQMMVERIEAIKDARPSVPDSIDEARVLWRSLLARHPQLLQEPLPI